MYFGAVKPEELEIYADSKFNCLMPYHAISRESLDEMFNTEGGYGCGWMKVGRREPAYLHSGGTPSYMSHNLYCQTKRYGNLYLIILNPTVRNPSHAESIMKDLLMNY